jgi:hypothetical protein
MKYTVVYSSRGNPDKALRELIEEVNQMIEQGWKPIGGIAYSMWGLMANTYHQAMVLETE